MPVPGLGIVILPRESQVQPADAVQRHLAVERIVAGSPHHGLAAVGRDLRPAQMVVVQVVQLVAAHHRDRLATQAQEVGRAQTVPVVLHHQLAIQAVHEAPGVGWRLVLVGALTQCIDPVVRVDTVPGRLAESVEDVVRIRGARHRGDVAVGVVHEGLRAWTVDADQPVAGARRGIAVHQSIPGVTGAVAK